MFAYSSLEIASTGASSSKRQRLVGEYLAKKEYGFY